MQYSSRSSLQAVEAQKVILGAEQIEEDLDERFR